MNSKKICKIDGCDKPECNSRGWCWKHYVRWRRYGDPLSGSTFDGEPMHWFKDVALEYSGIDCLHWPFGKDGNGRGKMIINDKSVLVHRFLCEIINGPPQPQSMKPLTTAVRATRDA